MISSTEPNIKFSDEQTKQLDTFGRRLLGLQTEISIADTESKTLKAEVVKNTAENNELVASIAEGTKQLSQLDSQIEKKKAEVSQSNSDLEAHKEEHDRLTKLHVKRTADLDERDGKLKEAEETIVKKNAVLEKQSDALAAEKKLVAKSKDAFRAALESVTWK